MHRGIQKKKIQSLIPAGIRSISAEKCAKYQGELKFNSSFAVGSFAIKSALVKVDVGINFLNI